MDKHITKENDDVDCCKESMKKIRERLPKILEDPIIKNFLEKEENKVAFYKAINSLEPSEFMQLDQKFQHFYRINRITRYLTGFIKRYPISGSFELLGGYGCSISLFFRKSTFLAET